MTQTKIFKKTLNDKYLFFRLIDFNPDLKNFESVIYNNYEYFAFNCIFIKGDKIKQNVNGQLLLTFKGFTELLKQYENMFIKTQDPLFYGRYNRFKNVEINHVSKWKDYIIENYNKKEVDK